MRRLVLYALVSLVVSLTTVACVRLLYDRQSGSDAGAMAIGLRCVYQHSRSMVCIRTYRRPPFDNGTQVIAEFNSKRDHPGGIYVLQRPSSLGPQKSAVGARSALDQVVVQLPYHSVPEDHMATQNIRGGPAFHREANGSKSNQRPRTSSQPYSPTQRTLGRQPYRLVTSDLAASGTQTWVDIASDEFEYNHYFWPQEAYVYEDYSHEIVGFLASFTLWALVFFCLYVLWRLCVTHLANHPVAQAHRLATKHRRQTLLTQRFNLLPSGNLPGAKTRLSTARCQLGQGTGCTARLDAVATCSSSHLQNGVACRANDCEAKEPCVICLEELGGASGERVVALPCRHKLHYDCALKWALEQEEGGERCPLCLEPMLPR